MGCGASSAASGAGHAPAVSPSRNESKNNQGTRDVALNSNPGQVGNVAATAGAIAGAVSGLDLEGVVNKINNTVLGGIKLLDSPFIDAAAKILPAFGDTLQTIANVVVPPPGGQVVAAVLAIARIVIMEIKNNQTCIELAQDCHEMLSFLLRKDNCDAIQMDPNMREALDKFWLVAQDIETFVKDVNGSRNWFARLAAYADTQRRLADFRSKMVAVSELMKFQATVNSFKFLQTADGEAKQVAQRLADLKLQYNCTDLSQLVKNPEARKALGDLPGASATDSVMINQLTDVQDHIEEQNNRGVWKLVQHPTMSKMWRSSFATNEKVDWDTFWLAFPSQVSEENVQVQLVDFFKDEAHKKLFQFAVDKEDEKTISVPEVNQAFPPHEEDLMKQVKRLKDTMVNADETKLIAQLDHIPAEYVERKEVALLADKIMESRVVLVTGFPGVGKVTLAAAAARHLLSQNKIKEVFALDVDKDPARLPTELAKCFSSVMKEQNVEQVISAKLAALKFRNSEFKESGWPVVCIFNDCEQVKHNPSELRRRIDQLLAEVPGMRVVLCSRDASMDLGKDISPVTFTVTEPELAAGVAMFKAFYKKDISDQHVTQLVRKAACVPALIKVMVGYLLDEDNYSLSDLLQTSLDDAIDGMSQAQAMKAVIITALEVLGEDLVDLVIMVLVLPATFEASVLQKVLDKNKFKVTNLQKRFKSSSVLTTTSDGLLAVVPVVYDMIKLIQENTSKQEYSKLKDRFLTAQSRRQDASLQFALAISDEVDNLYSTYATSPLTVCDKLSRQKPSIQKVLSDDDPQLMAKPEFKAAVLRMMRQLVYTPLIFDKPVIQDACTAKAEAWGGEPTGLAVAALFYVNSANDDAHGHKPCLAKAEKVLSATVGASEESAIIARSLALRAKALILRDKFEQLDVAIQAHYEGAALVEPLVASGSLQAKLEKVVHLGEVTGTLDYLNDKQKNEEGLVAGAKALAAAKAVFGEAVDHPITAMVLGALGYNLRNLGKLQEAKEHHQRALAMREAVLKEHPETAMSLNQLAMCLQDLGDLERAEDTLLKSLDIRIRCLGEKDPLVANTEEALFNVRLKQSDAAGGDTAKREAAFRSMRQVLTIRRATLGEGHKKLVGPAEKLVTLLEQEGRGDEAKFIRERYLPKA